MNPNRTYLGDGVYASFNGYQICLTTEDGMRVTNRIYLEPEVFNALLRFAETIRNPPPEHALRGGGEG